MLACDAGSRADADRAGLPDLLVVAQQALVELFALPWREDGCDTTVFRFRDVDYLPPELVYGLHGGVDGGSVRRWRLVELAQNGVLASDGVHQRPALSACPIANMVNGGALRGAQAQFIAPPVDECLRAGRLACCDGAARPAGCRPAGRGTTGCLRERRSGNEEHGDERAARAPCEGVRYR
ncbi:hypothetical protein ABW99_04060 [Pandoraea thiooxydans]|uniref:Uncharacterized protein n=1 Tax=Pandoraea thiooxydans TaxID=445709 RepID=A0A0G3EKH0_9BURK|nr:hypothetical protein ABW99_04060 [Pandoraea thiooxydans]